MVVWSDPANSTKGGLAAIEGGTLVLDDHAEGFATIPATEAFLEARREIFDDCINQILGSNAGAVLKSAESAAAALHSGPGRKEKIDDALKYLREKASLEPVPGAKFAFGPMLLSGNNGFPVNETIPKPLLVFDPSGTRKDDWNERGIKKTGHMIKEHLAQSSCELPSFVRPSMKAKSIGLSPSFWMACLKSWPGSPASRDTVMVFCAGLSSKSQALVFLPPRARRPKTTWRRAAKHWHRRLMPGSDGVLALVQVEEEFKGLDGGSNPYYATKSVFLKRDVPVQKRSSGDNGASGE